MRDGRSSIVKEGAWEVSRQAKPQPSAEQKRKLE